MTSVVEICNMAIGAVRGQSINSIDQPTLAAQTCKLYYPICRDILLEEVTWGFSRKIVALAVLEDVVFGWPYVYQYPNDCLVINDLIRNIDNLWPVAGDYYSPTASRWNNVPDNVKVPRAEYLINIIGVNKVVLAKEAELRIDYRSKVTNSTLFSNQFIGALVQLLASYIAVPLAGAKEGIALGDKAMEKYYQLLNAAATNSVNEQHRTPPESEFITVRN